MKRLHDVFVLRCHGWIDPEPCFAWTFQRQTCPFSRKACAGRRKTPVLRHGPSICAMVKSSLPPLIRDLDNNCKDCYPWSNDHDPGPLNMGRLGFRELFNANGPTTSNIYPKNARSHPTSPARLLRRCPLEQVVSSKSGTPFFDWGAAKKICPFRLGLLPFLELPSLQLATGRDDAA